FIEPLRIDVMVKRQRRAVPRESKFSARQREPLFGYWIVGNITTVESNCFAVKEVRESLVSRGGVAQASRCNGKACNKVFIQLAIEAETHAKARSIAARDAVLKGAFPSQADVSAQAKPSQNVLQGSDLLRVVPIFFCYAR